MSLSFREQAAIAVYTMNDTTSNDSARAAQQLAEACCEEWGHDLEASGGTLWCARCGALLKSADEAP
jgi:hypothetical protein